MRYRVPAYIAICLSMAVACTEEITTTPQGDGIVATARIADTKVSFSQLAGGDLHGSWEIGDQIKGFSDNGEVTFTVASVDEKTGIATLSQTSAASISEGETLRVVYCPGCSYSEEDPGKIEIDFSEQSNTLLPAMMFAEATVGNGRRVEFSFENKCAIIGIISPLLNTPDFERALRKVVVSGRSIVSAGEARLNGGHLEFVADTPSDFIVKAISAVVKDSGDGVNATISQTIYVAVPPCKVDRVTLVDNHGTTYAYQVGKTAEASRYYEIKGKSFVKQTPPSNSGVSIGGVDWAKWNLGGSQSTGAACWGDIYRWADDQIIYTAKTSSSITFDASHAQGFVDYSGEAFWNGSGFDKYNETDGKTTLDPVDDPVQLAYPGTGWRMPTAEEFKAVVAASTDSENYTTTFDPNSNKGVKIEQGSNNVFFPRNHVCSNGGTATRTARYWTSTPVATTEETTHPYVTSYYFVVNSATLGTGVAYRRLGYAIRPVKKSSNAGSGSSDTPEPERPLLNQGKSVTSFPEWSDISIDYSNLTSSDHPRLFLFDKDIKAIQTAIEAGSNTFLSKISTDMIGAASVMARKKSEIAYPSDGSRITQTSRKAIHRIVDLSYAYRLTGEEKYLEMAEWNINMFCDYPDWNDSHFLDAAEMATAVAIGYDWLYKDLSDETKAKAVQKLSNYAMTPGLERPIYKRTGNWNQVCCGGLIVAALATYESNPALSDEVIRRCMAANAKEVKAIYAPNGAFPEGPGYWEYGTTYQGILNLALETALGTDFELPKVEGFSGAGDYYAFVRGSSGKRFNYSDSGEDDEPSIGMWYMAYCLNNPDYLYHDLYALDDQTYLHDYYSFIPLTIALKMGNMNVEAPKGRLYTSGGANPVLMCRTGWGSDDLYLALKGGQANISHAHMDAGEVVFDAYGTRWFKDFTYTTNYVELEVIFNQMGLQYNDIGKREWDSMRWQVFQYRNMQHSTITVDGKNHWPYGVAEIYDSYDTAERLGGYVDLTNPFYEQLTTANRTAVIRNGSYLEITDQMQALSDGHTTHIRWTCASDAQPTIVSGGIELYDGKTTMVLTTNAPGAVYKTWSVDPADYETVLPRGEDPLEGYLCGFEYDIESGAVSKIVTTLKKKN